MTSSKYEFNAHRVVRRTIPFTKDLKGKKNNPQFFMACNINEILFRVKIDEHTTLTRGGSIVNCVLLITQVIKQLYCHGKKREKYKM